MKNSILTKLTLLLMSTSVLSFSAIASEDDPLFEYCKNMETGCELEEKRVCNNQTRRGCRGWEIRRYFHVEGGVLTAEQFKEFAERRMAQEKQEEEEQIASEDLPTEDTEGQEGTEKEEQEAVVTTPDADPEKEETVVEVPTEDEDTPVATTRTPAAKPTVPTRPGAETITAGCKNCSPLLKTFVEVAEAEYIDDETPVKYKTPESSSSFKICQRAMAANGINIVELSNTRSLSSRKEDFARMAKTLAQYSLEKKRKPKIDLELYSDVTGKDLAQLEARAKEEAKHLNSSIMAAIEKVRTCVLLVEVTRENFDKTNQRYKDVEYTKPEAVTSFDQRLKCVSYGLETIDYDECRNMIYAYNASKVVTDGNEALQVFQGQEQANEANMKLMDMKPNEDVSTKSLEVQKDGISKQKEMAEVRAGLQSAKLATMIGFAAKLPDQDTVIQKCAEGKSMGDIVSHVYDSLEDGIINTSSAYLNDYKEDSDTQCLASFQNDDHGILANLGQRPTATAIAAEAGIDVAKELAAVDMLGKQEKMVDGVINKVKGMDTIDLPEDAFQSPELVTFCQANPNAQECVGFGTGMTTHVNSGGLSFTGGLAANETLNPTTDSSDNATAITTGSEDRDSNASLPSSRAIASVDKGGGFSDGTPSAAKVSSSLAGSGGGAGGGGAPGGGGLSGSGPSTGGKGVAPTSGSKRYKLGYSGGSRPLSFRGGSRKSKRSPSKGAGNPFAKMLKKKGKSSDVFNFRGLASQGIGSKDGDLFKRISNSYDTVNKKNRLLKYKISE